MVTFRSFRRASPPVTEVNAASAPVQENTSSSASGRSTRGNIAFTAARRSVSEAGSGSGSSAAKCSRPASSTLICALLATRPATSR